MRSAGRKDEDGKKNPDLPRVGDGYITLVKDEEGVKGSSETALLQLPALS